MTAEFGSLVHEQIAPGPVKREYPNQTNKHRLPRNHYELYSRCASNFAERRRDALLSAQDDIQALEERTRLRKNPIYTGEVEPIGDNSVIIIQPGYGRGKDHYEDTVRCFRNLGYQAMVMPTPWGANIAPSRLIAEDGIRIIRDEADRSGKPVTIVGHSKGVLDTEAIAGLYSKAFESTVGRVFEIRFPNHVEWINDVVLCKPTAFSLFVSEQDIQAIETFALSIRETGVRAVAVLSLEDNIVRGYSDAQEVLMNNGSHRGALSNAENIEDVTERLPKRDSLPIPTAA